ncbi:MAG: ABC transporter permease [Tannerellaceae bacterium]|nr:ABC transporter permease [Tannerellaceae bacterium]
MNNLLNFKSFLKFLSKNKSYTFIDIFGLSVSLMFVVLIAIYTKQELTVDSYHEKKDRIYVLANDEHLGTAYRIADRMLERYPEIEKVCATTTRLQEPVTIGDVRLSADLLLADTTFFDLFDFELIQGNKERILEAHNYAVISETFARKAFPSTDPLGKMIRMNDSVHVVVNGIMRDIKNSAIPSCDILFRMDNIKYFNPGMDSYEFDNTGSVLIFILEAYARGTPFDRGNNYTVVYNGKNISFQALVGDSAYFHMLGYEILMDNNLGNPDGYYLNEQSFLELEIADDVPSILIGEDWNLTITGKVKDFQLRNISYNKNPVLLQLKKVEDFSWEIREQLIHRLKMCMNEFPG